MKPLSISATAAVTALIAGVSVAPAHAQGEVTAKLLPSGAAGKTGGYAPQRLLFTTTKPSQVTKVPAYLTAPQYGLLKFGVKEYVLTLDESAADKPVLLVDSNGNGDLTDDQNIAWTPATYKGGNGMLFKRYEGTAKLPILGGDGKPVGVASLNLYRFDKKDTGRPALKDMMLYYRDYGVEGSVTLAGRTYPFLLDDAKAGGDFSKPDNVTLLIDINGNGKFERRGESYPVNAPFNIAGTTYEISNVSPSGDKFIVKKSAQTVAEVLPPSDLSSGKRAIAFAAKTTTGEAIQFPGSYRGKLVLLDFWATWCGPCIGELPNLTKAYETYHPKGFEILGISLDQANAAQKLASFTAQMKMPWQQVYDGKYWKAEVAQLYDIHSIPAAFLVDGDTGEVIASGNALRGEGLSKVLAEAIARKTKQQATAK